MKWGLVNFDCSALWVRVQTRLTEALNGTSEFLRNKHAQKGSQTAEVNNSGVDCLQERWSTIATGI